MFSDGFFGGHKSSNSGTLHQSESEIKQFTEFYGIYLDAGAFVTNNTYMTREVTKSILVKAPAPGCVRQSFAGKLAPAPGSF
jgi:hypothetical protein